MDTGVAAAAAPSLEDAGLWLFNIRPSLNKHGSREVKVAQAIIENARSTILVADSMKFERSAPVRIGHLSQLNSFVTDKPLPDHVARICHDSELQVVIAERAD